MERPREAALDAALYAASAIFAGFASFLAATHSYREWGRIAAGPYAAGAMALTILLARRAAGPRARAWVAGAMLLGAALLPLGVEVAWRARTSPGEHVQAEAIVTEEAAKALVHGRDPYAVTYLHGPLASRPLGTKTHFPYLPVMTVFGLPRALAGDRPFADARVWFAATTMAIAAAALAVARPPGRSSLRVIQLLLVLPTGALLLATGGDDLPVLALLLLALVLADRDRPWQAGIALGLAVATKQTAWVLVPFVGAALLAAGRRAGRPFIAAVAAVALPIIGAFMVWNPGAFWEDVILFPLGLGQQRTSAATPTIGSLLVHAFPGATTAITAALAFTVAIASVSLLVIRSPRSVRGAAQRAALVFAIAILLAPAARAGYAVYPIELLAWAALLARRTTPPASEVA